MRVEWPTHTVVLPTVYHICLPMMNFCVQNVDCLVYSSLDIINNSVCFMKISNQENC